MNGNLSQLLRDVRGCRLCEEDLKDGVRPVLQVHSAARILIAGQAPGRRVHESGVPFDDQSGNRLREWLKVDHAAFYDSKQFAILPMAFCFPGTGKSGDLPPRAECANAWRDVILEQLPSIRLTLVIGRYSMRWHLPTETGNVTETVANWRTYGPTAIPLPHPSPRNNIWLKRNSWFELELLPYLRQRVSKVLSE
jgi:uracil-DNA glycosylase